MSFFCCAAPRAKRGSLVSGDEFPTTDRTSLIFCCLATALSDLNFSLIAPFFPSVALSHGLTSTGIGVIFAAQPLSVMIGALLAPDVLERSGPFVSLRAATFAQAAFTFVMATTDHLFEGWLPFLVACTCLRVLQGLACGLTETASASLAMRSVPADQIAGAVGMVSAARAVGVVAGPPLGGLGFDFLGFAAPFAFASALLLTLAFVMVLLPVAPAAMSPATKANAPTGQLLRVGEVLAALVAMWSVHSSITFLAPTLQPYLAGRPFDFSSSQIGLVFTLCDSVPGFALVRT